MLKEIFNNGYNLTEVKINNDLDSNDKIQTIKIYNPNNKKEKLIVIGNDYNIDVKRLMINFYLFYSFLKEDEMKEKEKRVILFL